MMMFMYVCICVCVLCVSERERDEEERKKSVKPLKNTPHTPQKGRMNTTTLMTLDESREHRKKWEKKIRKAFEDELRGEGIDEEDVDVAIEMFVEIVSTSNDFDSNAIEEALEIVSSDDDSFDRANASKEIFERIQLLGAYAFPVRKHFDKNHFSTHTHTHMHMYARLPDSPA